MSNQVTPSRVALSLVLGSGNTGANNCFRVTCCRVRFTSAQSGKVTCPGVRSSFGQRSNFSANRFYCGAWRRWAS